MHYIDTYGCSETSGLAIFYLHKMLAWQRVGLPDSLVASGGAMAAAVAGDWGAGSMLLHC